MEKALRRTLASGRFVDVSNMRSRVMGAVRSRDNHSTEVMLKMALVRAGLSGWKLHQRYIVGCPDFLFQANSLVIFVDGCFWHGCPQCGHLPRSNARFWATKIMLNKSRDQKATRALRSQGYRVLRMWEHEVASNLDRCLAKIVGALSKARKSQKILRFSQEVATVTMNEKSWKNRRR